MKLLLNITLFVFVVSLLKAQKTEFGNVDIELLLKSHSELDSSAAAEILYVEGNNEIREIKDLRNRIIRYETVEHRYHKIKIYDKNRFAGNLDVKIMLYSGKFSDYIENFKCVTYNLNGNAIEETILTQNEILEEETTKNFKILKFAIPNVKDGSVVEYSYTVVSMTSFKIRDWLFQSEYPTLKSIYTTKFPKGFIFETTVTGYDNVNVKKTDDETTVKWEAENIPAFIAEPYTVNENEFKTTVRYELISYTIYNGIEDKLAREWNNIDEDLRNRADFFLRTNDGGVCNQIAKKSISEHSTNLDIVTAIYNTVRDSSLWSKYNTIYSTESFKKVSEGELASTADINLFLIASINAAGYKACPVILSTRDHGKLHEHLPSWSRFNYVIARVNIDGVYYYLDATDKFLPFGMLPKRALNGMARYVCKTTGDNLILNPSDTYKKSINCICDISDGKINITKTENHFGYSAFERRTDIFNDGGLQNFRKKTIEESENELTDSIRIKNYSDDLTKPLELTFKYRTESEVSQTDDLMFFSPLLDESIEKNPFKLAERKYPVDFAYPIDERIVMQFSIPEGWSVTDLPESVSYTLPDNGGGYYFKIQQVGQVLQVVRKFNINKPIFIFNEYPDLKLFYDLIAKKEAEKIVFKKN